MTQPTRPMRLFLDAGVIILGCCSIWDASHTVLSLATERARFTIVLAEEIEREVKHNMEKKVAAAAATDALVAQMILTTYETWLGRARIQRCATPPKDVIDKYRGSILPVIRHGNDLPSVVTAIEARPDWILSLNRDHWNDDLSTRTGLRITSPLEFVRQLRIP